MRFQHRGDGRGANREVRRLEARRVAFPTMLTILHFFGSQVMPVATVSMPTVSMREEKEESRRTNPVPGTFRERTTDEAWLERVAGLG